MTGFVVAAGAMLGGAAVAGEYGLGLTGLPYAAVAMASSAAIGSVATSVLTGRGNRNGTGGESSLVGARQNGQALNLVATDEPIPVPYGFVYDCPSVIPYKDVDPADDTWYYRVHVIGEGEIEAFDACKLDGVLSTDARFAGALSIEYHTGTEAQTASAMLLAAFPSKWTANDTGVGIAYAVLKIKNDPTVFPNGEPVATFDIRGRKLYDTRDGVTRFSNNPALVIRDYWTNTRYGRRVGAAKIDDTKISTEASYFEGREAVPDTAIAFTADATTDELTFAADIPYDNGDGVTTATSGVLPAGLAAATTYYFIRTGLRSGKLATTYANALAHTVIDITDAGTGTHTMHHVDQARYTCDGMIDPTADPYSNLDALRSSCRSWFFPSGGVYHLVCDKPAVASATFALSEDNIVGAWSFEGASEDGHFNRVVAQIVDVARENKTNYAISDNAAELAEDGGKLMEGRIRLDFTTNWYRGQRIAQIERRKSRLGWSISPTATLEGFQAFPGEVYNLTHSTPGWIAKPFRLMHIDLPENDEYPMQLAEYSDAVWTLDAQSAMPLPVRTNLPDPATAPPAPGAPAIAESAYVGSDGANAATKATMTWAASSSASVADYQPEYKLYTDSTWFVLAHTGNVLTRDIMDVAPGVYDFRVRGFNSVGVPSAYSPTTRAEIYGPNTRPAAPASASLQSAGGLAIVSWPQSTDLYVTKGGRVLIRHCESTASPSWESSFSIGEPDGYAGDAVLAVLPLKAGTYLVKFENRAGLQSSGAATIATKQATALTFTSLTTLQEDTTYPGTHSNTVAIDGLLKLGSAGLFDDIADFDSISSVDDCGGVAASGTYTFSAGYDAGAVTRMRLTGQLEGLTVNVNDLIDSRLGNIDDWVDFDGTSGGGSADAYLEVRETDDNPAAAPTWSAWKRLDAAELNCRAVQARAQLRSTDPAYNIHISKLRLKAQPIT